MVVSTKGHVELQKQNETSHVYGASGLVLGVSLDSRCWRKCYGQGKHDTLCHFFDIESHVEKKTKLNALERGGVWFLWYSTTPSVDPYDHYHSYVVLVFSSLYYLLACLSLYSLLVLVSAKNPVEHQMQPNAQYLRGALFYFTCLTRFWNSKKIFPT